MYAIRSYYAQVGDAVDPEAVRLLADRVVGKGDEVVGVITSYSIHYTKLYEPYTSVLLGEQAASKPAARGSTPRTRAFADVARLSKAPVL